ncbi:MAG: hypothetical protein AB8G96_03965 [Phycisphaerales bacterium]
MPEPDAAAATSDESGGEDSAAPSPDWRCYTCGYARAGRRREQPCSECGGFEWHQPGPSTRRAVADLMRTVRICVIFWLLPLVDAVVDTPVVNLAVLGVVGVVSVRRQRSLGVACAAVSMMGIVVLAVADVIGPDAWLASRAFVRWGFSLLVGVVVLIIIGPTPDPRIASPHVQKLCVVALVAVAALLAVPGIQVAKMAAIRSEARSIATWVDAEASATGQRPADLTGYPWRRPARAANVRYRPGPAYPIEAGLRYRIDIRAGEQHPFRSWYGEPGGWRRDPW